MISIQQHFDTKNIDINLSASKVTSLRLIESELSGKPTISVDFVDLFSEVVTISFDTETTESLIKELKASGVLP